MPLMDCDLLLLFVVQSCWSLWGPMNCSMPGFPILEYLPGFAQTHVHWVGDAIQPSHSLSLHSSPVIYNQNIHLVFIPISGPELLKPLEFPKKCHKGIFCSVHAVTFGKPQVTYAWGLVTRGSNYVIRGLEFIVTNPQDWERLGRRLNCYQWPVV